MTTREKASSMVVILAALAALGFIAWLEFANWNECRESHSFRYCLTAGGK